EVGQVERGLDRDANLAGVAALDFAHRTLDGHTRGRAEPAVREPPGHEEMAYPAQGRHSPSPRGAAASKAAASATEAASAKSTATEATAAPAATPATVAGPARPLAAAERGQKQ